MTLNRVRRGWGGGEDGAIKRLYRDIPSIRNCLNCLPSSSGVISVVRLNHEGTDRDLRNQNFNFLLCHSWVSFSWFAFSYFLSVFRSFLFLYLSFSILLFFLYSFIMFLPSVIMLILSLSFTPSLFYFVLYFWQACKLERKGCPSLLQPVIGVLNTIFIGSEGFKFSIFAREVSYDLVQSLIATIHLEH